MKYSKVAAVLAGSVMAAGMAAPAFAEDTSSAPVSTENMSTMPTSVNGGLDQALKEQPLQKSVDGTHLMSAVSQLQSTAGSTLAGPVGKTALGAVPGASLLGGLPLGTLGLPLG